MAADSTVDRASEVGMAQAYLVAPIVEADKASDSVDSHMGQVGRKAAVLAVGNRVAASVDRRAAVVADTLSMVDLARAVDRSAVVAAMAVDLVVDTYILPLVTK